VRFTGLSIILLAGGLPVNRVGGRLVGRFWYNAAFGGR
jgi:hypothetical protein